MVGKRSFLLCLLLICFSAFASKCYCHSHCWDNVLYTGIYCACITGCRVQKPSRVKSQSVKRSEHVQSDSQDQLKNDHGEYAECHIHEDIHIYASTSTDSGMLYKIAKYIYVCYMTHCYM